mmetsp:Transcript_2143/g.7828  ORF Transcript_2143/g.7828 Transcript_2143/m.7828 type:complete len:275 (+) Transcript_2143:946-1770(+)
MGACSRRSVGCFATIASAAAHSSRMSASERKKGSDSSGGVHSAGRRSLRIARKCTADPRGAWYDTRGLTIACPSPPITRRRSAWSSASGCAIASPSCSPSAPSVTTIARLASRVRIRTGGGGDAKWCCWCAPADEPSSASGDRGRFPPTTLVVGAAAEEDPPTPPPPIDVTGGGGGISCSGEGEARCGELPPLTRTRRMDGRGGTSPAPAPPPPPPPPPPPHVAPQTPPLVPPKPPQTPPPPAVTGDEYAADGEFSTPVVALLSAAPLTPCLCC